MNNHAILKLLFTALHGTLPYEYNEKYINGVGLEDTIAISKTNSDHVIYINKNTPDENCVFDVTLYDDIHDDDPTELTILDIEDPNFDFLDLIAYIKKTL